MRLNELGQPIGEALPDWTPRALPGPIDLAGAFCRVETLAEPHFDALAAVFALDRTGANFTYLPYQPFADRAVAREFLNSAAASSDPLFTTVTIDRYPVGIAAVMRLDPQSGVFEIGHIHFSVLLQRTRPATEALFLLLRHMFETLGYRRGEWKCDALNAPSRRAAERLGFQFEGLFRQALVTKGRNRDTAWYSIIDGEWLGVADRIAGWLRPENFDAQGRQRSSLHSGVEKV